MTPLQKVAMGLVIVLLDTHQSSVDLVPDVLGWVLVLLGVRDLRGRLVGRGPVAALAVLAGAVSLTLVWPPVTADLGESVQWLLSLPQLAFSIALCTALAGLAEPEDPRVARRLRFLGGVFVVLVAAPVLVYGGGLDLLLTPVAVVSVVAQVYLVYLLFSVSRRPWALRPAG